MDEKDIVIAKLTDIALELIKVSNCLLEENLRLLNKPMEVKE